MSISRQIRHGDWGALTGIPIFSLWSLLGERSASTVSFSASVGLQGDFRSNPSLPSLPQVIADDNVELVEGPPAVGAKPLEKSLWPGVGRTGSFLRFQSRLNQAADRFRGRQFILLGKTVDLLGQVFW